MLVSFSCQSLLEGMGIWLRFAVLFSARSKKQQCKHTWLLVIVCNILHQHSQTNMLIVISYLRSVTLQAPLFLSHPRYSRPSAGFFFLSFFNARPLLSLYFQHAINNTHLAVSMLNRENSWHILLGSKVNTCSLMPNLTIYRVSNAISQGLESSRERGLMNICCFRFSHLFLCSAKGRDEEKIVNS